MPKPAKSYQIILPWRPSKPPPEPKAKPVLKPTKKSEARKQAFTTFTVKSFPVGLRREMVKAAGKNDETMAKWLADAVMRKFEAGPVARASEVLPPGKPDPEPPPLPDIDLAGLAAAINASITASAAAGVKPSRTLGEQSSVLLRHYMRRARGLHGTRPRPTKQLVITGKAGP